MKLIKELATFRLGQFPKYRLEGTYYAQVVKVYDGDTITVVMRTAHDRKFYEYSVRMYGYDSPELRPSKRKDYSESAFADRDAEIKAAKAARDYLSHHILETPVELEIVPSDDKYGRLLCKVRALDGLDLNQQMIDNGHGYPYHGGQKRL